MNLLTIFNGDVNIKNAYARRKWKNNIYCHCFPGRHLHDLAYREVSEYITFREPRVKSQNAEKITRESFSLEQFDNKQLDDKIIAVEKAFWNLLAAILQKSEPSKFGKHRILCVAISTIGWKRTVRTTLQIAFRKKCDSEFNLNNWTTENINDVGALRKILKCTGLMYLRNTKVGHSHTFAFMSKMTTLPQYHILKRGCQGLVCLSIAAH